MNERKIKLVTLQKTLNDTDTSYVFHLIIAYFCRFLSMVSYSFGNFLNKKPWPRGSTFWDLGCVIFCKHLNWGLNLFDQTTFIVRLKIYDPVTFARGFTRSEVDISISYCTPSD